MNFYKNRQCYLIKLNKYPIYKQLQLEEALLRSSEDNFIILNQGSTEAIVLGISQKLDNEVNIPSWNMTDIPVIKRYSGGGSVVVDNQTFFVSFIMNDQEGKRSNPKSIHKAALNLYAPLFDKCGIELVDNDYVIRNKKVGGNAQCITRSRWVHHTTFLYNTSFELMNLLKEPLKRPEYRKDRVHSEFCSQLSPLFSCMDEMVALVELGVNQAFDIQLDDVLNWKHYLNKEHRKSVFEMRHDEIGTI